MNGDATPSTLGLIQISGTVALCDRVMRVVELHGATLDNLDLTSGRVSDRAVGWMSAELRLEIQRNRAGRDWLPDQRQRQRKRLNLSAIERAIDDPATAPPTVATCAEQHTSPAADEHPATESRCTAAHRSDLTVL